MSIEVQLNDQKISIGSGKTLFQCADKVEIKIPSSCKRRGICGECLTQVTEGNELLEPPNEAEKHLTEGFRLACQAKIVAESGHIRCHTLRRGRMKIVKTSAEDLRDVTGYFDPAVTRSGDDVLMDGDVIESNKDPIHGIAMDIGTTTIVMNVVNLETGETVHTTAFENPQAFGGSDIMTRICYERDHGANILQRALHAYLEHAISELPVPATSIYEMLIVGNTTMRDMFFGLDVWPIGQKPYRSLVEESYRNGKRASTTMTSISEMMGLTINPQARVLSLPLVSGHVGADAAAVLVAIDMAHMEETVLVMDIGTNTELFVGNKDKILAASCPAGPAFEGGGITFGMPALAGAVERVKINDDGSLTIKTIEGKPPIGICGSGLIDIMGELVRTGKMNVTGRFDDTVGKPMMLDAKSQVSFAESDVSKLAQAKAANVAALQIVMKNYGITYDQVDKLYLAGGFAQHLDLDAAKRIGLIPNFPNEKIVRIGNAAVEGATMALRSVRLREEIEALVKTIKHIELEEDPEFFEYFVTGCLFDEVNMK